jgi:hypothetical protein
MQLFQVVSLLQFAIGAVIIRLLNLHLPFPRTLPEVFNSLRWHYPDVDPKRIEANKRAWTAVGVIVIITMIVFYQFR